MHLGGVTVNRDRERLASRPSFLGPAKGFVERRCRPVDIPETEPSLDALAIDLDEKADAAVQGDGERLGASHSSEASGEHEPAGQRAAEMLAGTGAEGLVGSLQNALCADVDPGARGHLSVHREPHRLVSPEVLPVAPLGHEERVGDEDPWRVRVRLEHSDRLAGLDEQGLVSLEAPERPHDRVIRLPAPGRLAGSSVDDEILPPLGDVRIEVVHEHPEHRFLRPAFAAELGPAWRSNGSGGALGERGHQASLYQRRASAGGAPAPRRPAARTTIRGAPRPAGPQPRDGLQRARRSEAP